LIRIESPLGRIYKAPPGYLPSVTTVLKDTCPDPFSSKKWIASLTRKGISQWEASIYASYWVNKGYATDVAVQIVSKFIDTPMSVSQAKEYMAWKGPHSSDRGTRLHHFLENTLPPNTPLQWEDRPTSDDPTVDLLVQSLWNANILQEIQEVVSLEEGLWWYKDGIGYAGSEDISYKTFSGHFWNGDWKSKDPKTYSQTLYSHEYKLQLVAYAGARRQRTRILVDGCRINYCYSNGQAGEQVIIPRSEARELWEEWHFRLQAWWTKLGKRIPEFSNE
jgi:hypothetical protein